MPIVDSTSTKKAYTRKDDEAIVKGLEAKSSVEDIAKNINRTPASVQYRIQRVLRNKKYNTLDDIQYKGQPAAAATPAPEKEKKK